MLVYFDSQHLDSAYYASDTSPNTFFVFTVLIVTVNPQDR